MRLCLRKRSKCGLTHRTFPVFIFGAAFSAYTLDKGEGQLIFVKN